MSSEKGPKHIYAQEHKLYYYHYHFGGHWKNKHWKNDNKTVYRIFFHQRCKETSTNFEVASRFWLAAYIVWLFDSHFSLVHFSRLKYILARKIRHSARQSDNNIPFEEFVSVFLSSFSTNLQWSIVNLWIWLALSLFSRLKMTSCVNSLLHTFMQVCH